MNGSGESRRRALRWLISGAGVALLAACQSAPGASTPTPVALRQQTPAAAAATVAPARTVAQPRTGGTLRVGRADELETLDGQRFVSNTIGITYGTVYERLIDYDEKVVPQPMLAESWDFSNG